VVNVFTTLGVLALFWFPAMAGGDTMWRDFTTGLVKILTFDGRGAWFTWIVCLLTLPSNMFTAILCKQEDATFATAILSVSPALSGLIMSLRPIFGRYYQPIDWTTWLSFVVVLGSVFLYKGTALYATMKNRRLRSDFIPIQDPDSGSVALVV
jgi:hypothetical protein